MHFSKQAYRNVFAAWPDTGSIKGGARWLVAARLTAGDLRSLLGRLAAGVRLGVVLGDDTRGAAAEEADGLLPGYGFGSMERNGAGFLKIPELDAIARDVQERHGNMGCLKTKGHDRFAKFLRETCEGSAGPGRLRLDSHTLAELGSPTVEIALLEQKFRAETDGGSLLPPLGSTVITSVATAGSGEKGEWNVWFDLFGRAYAGTTFATVLDSGVTGRNGHNPHEDAVPIKYDQCAPKATWAAVSQDLYAQLDRESGRRDEPASVDYIFHWGCISHYETPTPDGGTAEGWACHEHWNILFCIAMARHALDYLKQGGTLVLKVRMFENAETLALVSVLACAFDEVYLSPNPRMQAELVAFVGVGFKGECADVRLVREVLENSTSYRLSDICDARIVRNPAFHAAMRDAEDAREEMRRDHDRVTLVMMDIMYLIGANAHFDDDYLGEKLAALTAGLPAEIDSEWIPGVIAQVRYLTRVLQRDGSRASDSAKLRNFVQDFDLAKFTD